MRCQCCSGLSWTHLVVEDAPDGLHDGPLLHSAGRTRRQQRRVQKVAAQQTSQLLASTSRPAAKSAVHSHCSVGLTECRQLSHVGSGAAQQADAVAASLQLSCIRFDSTSRPHAHKDWIFSEIAMQKIDLCPVRSAWQQACQTGHAFNCKAKGFLLPGRDQSDVHGFTATSRGESLSVGLSHCN